MARVGRADEQVGEPSPSMSPAPATLAPALPGPSTLSSSPPRTTPDAAIAAIRPEGVTRAPPGPKARPEHEECAPREIVGERPARRAGDQSSPSPSTSPAPADETCPSRRRLARRRVRTLASVAALGRQQKPRAGSSPRSRCRVAIDDKGFAPDWSRPLTVALRACRRARSATPSPLTSPAPHTSRNRRAR